MSLFRRHKSGFSGVRGSKKRARTQPFSSSQVTLEELENRVLLSVSQIAPAVPFFTLVLPPRPAAISQTQQFSGSASSLAPHPGGMIFGSTNVGELGPISVHLPSSPASQPMTIVVRPRLSEGPDLANAAQPQLMVSSAINGPGSLVQAYQASPFVTIAASRLISGAYGTLDDISGFQPEAVLSTSSGAADWKTSTVENAEPPLTLSGPQGGQNWPDAPNAKREELTGTFSADQTTATFDFPVGGASADSFEMNLESMAGNGGMVPAFGQVELIGPNGVPIAVSIPPPGPGVLQAISMLLRNATAGSHLQVQIVAVASSSGSAGSSSASESGTTSAGSSSSLGSSTSFVLNVQRQDFADPTDSTGQGAQSPISIGTLVVAPAPQGGSTATYTSAAAADPAETTPADAQAVTTAVATTSAVSDDTTEPSTETSDSFNLRVLTGPLASRAASPLGPTLASIDAEATQQVDRHERAMSQEIEGLEPLDSEPSVAWRSPEPEDDSSDLQANRPRTFGFADDEGPVVDVRGGGMFPMKVTSRGRGQYSELAALWATLPSFPDAAGAESNSEQAEIALLEVAAVNRTRSESSETPHYVKAALGIAFGLMMTSGPLFPDLVAKLPRRVPKWILVLRARTRRNESPGAARSSLAKLTTWLRGRLLIR